MSRVYQVMLAVGLVLLAVIAYFVWYALSVTAFPVPPRSDTKAQYTVEPSTVVARIGIPIGQLRAGLEEDLPRTLLRINQRIEECVPKKQVKAFGAKLFKTPRIGCNLVGRITRGDIAIGGQGRVMTARMPISAVIEIRDIGDVVKRETATATANMRMQATLSMSEDWQLQPDIEISYSWANEPGIDVLGQRITFTGPADSELAKIIPDIERQLEKRVREIDVRTPIAGAWKDGFDSVSVNRDNPPVWLGLSPKSAGIDELEVSDGEIAANVMVSAGLRLFLGDKPAATEPTELGKNTGAPESEKFDIKVPVLADFAELEPVLLEALQKLAAKGIKVDDFAEFDTEFRSVTMFATGNGRLAVGIEAKTTPIGAETRKKWSPSRGTVWLTALPLTEANSETLRITDLEVYGDMETMFGNALVLVLASDQVKTVIERELVEDFRHDYDEVIAKAKEGLSSLELGRLALSFVVDEVQHGPIQVTGKGLFMPVSARGTVSAEVKPER